MEAVIIEKEALQLPDVERALLAYRLLASLSATPADVESALMREADSRLAGFRKGAIEAVSGPDAMAKFRTRFPR